MIRNYSPNTFYSLTKRVTTFLLVLLVYLASSYQAKAQNSDLSLTKTVNNNTPFIGDRVIFTIILTNNGPDIANGVSVRDFIPSGYGALTNISDGGATLGNIVNWVGLTVRPGRTIRLTVNALVLPDGDYNNRAEIIASNSADLDSDPTSSFDDDDLNDGLVDDDETDYVIVTPIFRSDLSLTKSVDNTTPKVGEEITFTLTLRNNGPDIARGITVEDIMQDGFANYTNINNGGTVSGNTITWSNMVLTSGQELSLTITAEVLTTGTYTNQAEITASRSVDLDSNPNESFDIDDLNDGIADDDETELVIISPTAVSDLSLEKSYISLDPNPENSRPHKGTQVVFTLVVSNDGPSDAMNVSVSDLLPQGFIWVSDDSFGDYSPSTGIWNIGDLSNGSSVNLNITTVISMTEPYTNIAEIITSDSFDPDSTVNNNDATEDDLASVSLDPVGLLIPEGFSPNGDTINDTFEIPGLGYLFPNFKMEIFNRFGNKVFDYDNENRTEPQWWDGFSSGRLTVGGNNPVPTGTYYYVLYFNQDNLDPLTDWIYLNR